MCSNNQEFDTVPNILKLEPKVNLSLHDYVILPRFVSVELFCFVVIDNKNTSVIAIGICPVMDMQTFLSATQKYQSAMAILYRVNTKLGWVNTEKKYIFFNKIEHCIEYIENRVYQKASSTLKSSLIQIEEKIKKVIYEQRRKPEETDMTDIEEGRILWTPPTKVLVKKGNNVQLRFLIGTPQKESVSYKWYCENKIDEDWNVVGSSHFFTIQVQEEELMFLGEASQLDGIIKCTQEVEVSVDD